MRTRLSAASHHLKKACQALVFGPPVAKTKKRAVKRDRVVFTEATEVDCVQIMAESLKELTLRRWKQKNLITGPLTPKQEGLLLWACRESLATKKPLDEVLEAKLDEMKASHTSTAERLR